MYRHISRRQFPPIPPDPVFPAEPPLQTGLAQLAAFWVVVKCHQCNNPQSLPLRQAAAFYGWTLPLSAYLHRLKCKTCQGPPVSALLVDRPDRMIPGTYGIGEGSRTLTLLPIGKGRNT